MKLLEKKEIHAKKQDEFVRSREEGLKLARRVDALRQTQAEEEKVLNQFRVSTLAKIHEETNEATKERDIVRAQLEEARRQRAQALSPILDEIAELDAKRCFIEERENDVVSRETAVQESERNIAMSRGIAAEELRRAADERRRAGEYLQEMEFCARESRLVFAEAETERDGALEFKKRIENEMKERDAQVAVKERAVTLREEASTKKEKELRLQERKLIDREQTLDREIKRLKAKN